MSFATGCHQYIVIHHLVLMDDLNRWLHVDIKRRGEKVEPCDSPQSGGGANLENSSPINTDWASKKENQRKMLSTIPVPDPEVYYGLG